ncbi:hypothetical protein SE19_03520 [Acidiplasma aeolicum]|uniref:DNA repair protein n=2 Tax=Acidiplasma TaxID=507753 RepID=A0A0Q0RQ27_9ARCH|nr:hypothetical protein TZ01_08485 [Acidiplasma sp. MBA-1]KPV46894.1 hypothetical protein SE19_03520 [Acidiplasma aeolicum]KQB34360.1 hypothetical protein AOG55_00885 [Acidiplasma cupricumulans]KQB35277.1 hypothetical protein AOG54_03215 [Acidiplasma aeolicum]
MPPELCVKCRGAKMLCGLSYCPVNITGNIKKIYNFSGNDISGSSPPSIFVGRYGYPKIGVYPSLPPYTGNTAFLEDESQWLKMNLNDFISSRLSLLRGKIMMDVNSASNPDYTLQDIQLTSLSKNPVNIEMRVSKSFNKDIILDENITPMGPSSPVDSISYENYKIDNRIEKVYYDVDLKASDGIIKLYMKGLNINEISRALSTGSLGLQKNRKIVPTRWSITAADETVSNRLVDELKDYSAIDEFLVFTRKTDGNLFMGILCPGNWMFEWGESWFPGSTWNYFGNSVEIELDYEGYYGRKTYPEIGGCYYSSRLAAAEKLIKMRKQACVMLWREIYPGFNIPLGVWYVRENVREMFNSVPEKFSDLESALKYLSGYSRVPIDSWIHRSNNIKYIRSNLDAY